MAITQPTYLVFLTITVALFYAAPTGLARIALLLVAGYVFYYFLSPPFWFVLVSTSLVAYLSAILIDKSAQINKAQAIMIVAVSLLALPLVYYKYAAFLLMQIDAALGSGPAWHASWAATHVLLPIGISFYVFQAIGYVADVYLGVTRAETNWLRFSLFMTFFPILSAGPIERSSRLIPQFANRVTFSSENILGGLSLIVFGLTLKFGVADPLAAPVNAVFADLSKEPPAQQLLAAVFFSFQLYADVFGYSLIAVGSGKLFGVDVIWNFRQPFLSPNIQEFWRRWHISLSNWLRDYLFLPMRAHWRRRPTLGPVLAIIVTFLIAGIWHGAGWNYIVYGLSQGLFLAGSILTLAWRNKLWNRIGVSLAVITPMRIFITFMMVTISLVFVRCQNLDDAWKLVGYFFTPRYYISLFRFDFDVFQPAYWVSISVLIGSDIAARYGVVFGKLPRIVQGAIYGVCGSIILYAWIIDRVPKPFIYYQY